MRRSTRLATIALLVAVLGAVAGCGGKSADQAAKAPPGPVYHRGVALDVQPGRTATEGPLRTEEFTYSSVDGARVPALFAVPTAQKPLGCLIFVPGFGAAKDAVPALREGLAKLRLATFSIDARNLGARGSLDQAKAAVKAPEGVRSMLLGTVADLRVGLDWLDQRPECHHNIAVLGTSFGGTVATHLAAQDHRIKAAILSAVGATYKQEILMRPLSAQAVHDLPDYVTGATTDPAVLAHAVDVLGPYDLERWVGRISPRPVMIIDGRFDPIVAPGDALQLAAAAREPKTILYFNGGHDPFAPGPDAGRVNRRATQFLIDSLDLPTPSL